MNPVGRAVVLPLHNKAVLHVMNQLRLPQLLEPPGVGQGEYLHLVLKMVGPRLQLSPDLTPLPLEPVRRIGELRLPLPGVEDAQLVQLPLLAAGGAAQDGPLALHF